VGAGKGSLGAGIISTPSTNGTGSCFPGARIRGYREEPGLRATDLARRYPVFAVRLPAPETPDGKGRIIGQRLDIRSRQTSRD